MKKTIKDFVKTKEPQVQVQARISESLHKVVAKKLKKEGLSWQEFVRAICLWYVEQK